MPRWPALGQSHTVTAAAEGEAGLAGIRLCRGGVPPSLYCTPHGLCRGLVPLSLHRDPHRLQGPVCPQTDTRVPSSRVGASEGLRGCGGGGGNPGGAHLDAVQQPAHAPVRVGLHIAQRVLRHLGDVGGVRVHVVCGAGGRRQGAVRSQRMCDPLAGMPPPQDPLPPTSLALTGRLVFHLIT